MAEIIRVDVAGFVDLILPTIKEACLHLEEKHGPLTQDPVRAAAILTAEVGEVALAALGVTGSTRPHSEDELMLELMQTIAVCIHMLLPLYGKPAPEEPTPGKKMLH